MIADIALVVIAVALLAKSADAFVVGAARLSLTIGLSPVVVGAVVIGFGTGLPELLVSSLAAARDELDLAVGNVVGSNLANLTLVLGVAGLLARPETLPRVVRREAPLSLVAVSLFGLLVQNGLTRAEGVLLLTALVTATAVMMRSSREPAGPVPEDVAASEVFVEEVEELLEEAKEDEIADIVAAPNDRDYARTGLGLVGTVASAQLLVAGAQGIATALELDGGFVGLTVVAVGTSLPELVTAIQSARRDETALLAGNVLGSNVFNSTAVAGTSALIGPGVISARGLTVIAVGSMIAVSLLAWLFLGLGGRLRRWEAAVLVGVYAATLPLTA